jgi:hypothetical protein
MWAAIDSIGLAWQSRRSSTSRVYPCCLLIAVIDKEDLQRNIKNAIYGIRTGAVLIETSGRFPENPV